MNAAIARHTALNITLLPDSRTHESETCRHPGEGRGPALVQHVMTDNITPAYRRDDVPERIFGVCAFLAHRARAVKD